MTKRKIDFQLECPVYPESYSILVDGKDIGGYLKVRYGKFKVVVDENGDIDEDGTQLLKDKVLLETETKGYGEFDPEEREGWLDKARDLLDKYLDGISDNNSNQETPETN